MLDRPVTTEQTYLHAILGELRAIRDALAPPAAKEDELFPEEVRLKEPSPSVRPLPEPRDGQALQPGEDPRS